MNASFFTATGTKSPTKVSLSKDIFGLEVKNHDLLKDAYLHYQANGRLNLAVTKTRGLVRGGGKKPWRQKGTGRARFGSSRTPLWRSGGIIFGPTGNENYKTKLSIKSKHKAIKQALSLSAADSSIVVIEDLKLKKVSTSDINKLLTKVTPTGTSLVVVDTIEDNLALATRNLQRISLKRASALSVYDILSNDNLIITKSALKELDSRLGDAK